MKFTITPLGGSSRSLAKVVDGIVRYLHPPTATPPSTEGGGIEGSSRYYADTGDEPGRWLGHAAASAGLVGDVKRDELASVLSGRDPHTGERLLTAQGSAGRRPRLGSGNHTAVSATGEPLYGEADAAVVIGLTRSEVVRMLDVGAALALSQLGSVHNVDHNADHNLGHNLGHNPGNDGAGGQPEGSYLVPIVAADGSRLVAETELARCITARELGTDPRSINGVGSPDDQFKIVDAARLAGVTAQYLRRAARNYEDNQDEIEGTLSAGRTPSTAFVVAERGNGGRWLVSRQELVAFLERRRAPAVRVAFDLTLTTEKSLGVLAMLGGPEVTAAVLGSIQIGNDVAMDWLEQHAAAGRVNGKSVPATGWTVASFRHLTSRALDPFPHHHNVVANTVILADGSRRALDARGLYRHTHAASALATAEMRHQLTTQLGVRWRPGRNGGWEIEGLSNAVLREFSTRRNEIDDALRELEEAIGRGALPGEIETIVLRTRPAKRHTPVAELIDDWRQRAARHGVHAEALAACTGHDSTLQDPDLGDMFRSLARPAGICHGGSVFTRADALVALANHPVPGRGDPQPLLCGAARLEEITDAFLTSGHVVRVGGGDVPMFSTVEMLQVQDRIATRFHAGLYRGASLTSDAVLDDAFAVHAQLSAEQRELVTSWCSRGHVFQAAIGRAGAGKTTTVAAAAHAWHEAGYRVVGAAVKGEAARTLAAATGIECETVAWYLAHDQAGANPFDARTVLVVDEASTLSDRDLDQLMSMVADAGGTLRLIGDPAQHGSIAAGGMFRVVCELLRNQTPELTTTHRVQDPDDRAAAQALREGRIDDALNALQRAGHLHVVDNELTMYRSVLSRWWDARQDGHDHPMVDRRNSTRHQLNRLAHRLRQVHGEVGLEEITSSGDRAFSVGDRVTARAPNRDLHPPTSRRAYVRNGALGTVVALKRGPEPGGDVISVDFEGLGVIDLPRSFFDHHRSRGGRSEVGIDHAYALTSYAVQGSTSDLSTSRVDATATRAETYVDITRGRLANHLYLTTTADPLDGEALPKLPAGPADEAVAQRLRRSAGELTAWELAQMRPELRAPSQALGL